MKPGRLRQSVPPTDTGEAETLPPVVVSVSAATATPCLPLKPRLATLTSAALLICALPMLAGNQSPRVIGPDSVDTELGAFDDMRRRASLASQRAPAAAIPVVQDDAAADSANPVLMSRASHPLHRGGTHSRGAQRSHQSLPRSFVTAPVFNALLTRIDSQLWRDVADAGVRKTDASADVTARLPGLAGIDFPSVLGGGARDRAFGTVYQRWEPMVSWRASAHDENLERPIAHVRCMGLSPHAVAKRADRYEKLIVDLAIGQGISASLVKAVVTKESCFNPKAVSTAGAMGLMQLMPATAKWLKAGDVGNPENNLRTGVRYLASLRKRFGTDELALAAYNAGPGNVERHGGIPPFNETQRYVEDVMAHYRRYVAVNRLNAR